MDFNVNVCVMSRHCFRYGNRRCYNCCHENRHHCCSFLLGDRHRHDSCYRYYDGLEGV